MNMERAGVQSSGNIVSPLQRLLLLKFSIVGFNYTILGPVQIRKFIAFYCPTCHILTVIPN
ncbi:hypothetical protein SAMN04489723_11880 [Algoriphagus aquimarinus]|uniref:Uncharacterized protein n=1 Tax=Algoriphagus aquimarinus TaxID=237018 RepID=A0A1I1C1Q9_9BACT|nr:hypothetical protein SAMN04489723_11880 [Algoriphagus aquimarinus]